MTGLYGRIVKAEGIRLQTHVRIGKVLAFASTNVQDLIPSYTPILARKH